MTLRALALIALFLALGVAGRMDYEEAKRIEVVLAERAKQGRCIRTYIVRPGGDAIRCNECRFVLADGSSITKEGC